MSDTAAHITENIYIAVKERERRGDIVSIMFRDRRIISCFALFQVTTNKGHYRILAPLPTPSMGDQHGMKWTSNSSEKENAKIFGKLKHAEKELGINSG